MAGNCRFIPLEQLRHLIQGKPNRFVLQLYIKLCLTILSPVDEDLTHIRFASVVVFHYLQISLTLPSVWNVSGEIL